MTSKTAPTSAGPTAPEAQVFDCATEEGARAAIRALDEAWGAGRVPGVQRNGVTPRQRVAEIVDCENGEQVVDALEATIREGARDGRVTDAHRGIERGFEETMCAAEDDDWARANFNHEQIEEAKRLLPTLRAMEQEAERRVLATAAPAQYLSALVIHVATRRRCGARSRASRPRHRGSRRGSTTRASSRGGDSGDGDPEPPALTPSARRPSLIGGGA